MMRFEKHLELTRQIIGACFEVHRVLGPGLLERFYRDALLHELAWQGLQAGGQETEFFITSLVKINDLVKNSVSPLFIEKIPTRVKCLARTALI
jgi:GxxExxY protein